MQIAINNRLVARKYQLTTLSRALDAVSPLSTLGRGYAIVRKTDGSIVRDANSLKIGEELSTQLQRGSVQSKVTGTQNS